MATNQWTKVELSSLVCADGRLNIRFSFTRDSYKGFLLHHSSFSYVIVSQKTYTQYEGSISFGRGNNFYSLSLRKTFFTQHLLVERGRFLNGEWKSKTLSPKLSVRDEGKNAPKIKGHREVWPFLIYCVKVDGFLTVNDREKAVCKCECEARSKKVVGEGGGTRVIILCIRKGKRTWMPTGNTRLLVTFLSSSTWSMWRMKWGWKRGWQMPQCFQYGFQCLLCPSPSTMPVSMPRDSPCTWLR